MVSLTQGPVDRSSMADASASGLLKARVLRRVAENAQEARKEFIAGRCMVANQVLWNGVDRKFDGYDEG